MLQLASTSCLLEASLSATCDSSASAGAARSNDVNSMVLFTTHPSGNLNIEPLHHVVVVAPGVEVELERLGRADPVGGAGHDGVRAGARRRDDVAPLAPGKPSQIGPELRRPPALASVLRDFDRGDAEAAVPGD